MENFKTLGVALMINELGAHLDWLKEDGCDLEIQGFWKHELLDGNWQSKVERAKKLLNGYSGRIGIHDPFWGLNLVNPDPLVRKVIKKRLMQGLTIAEQLKATHMMIHSPIDPWIHRKILNNKGEKDRLINIIKDTLLEPLGKAKEISCTLVLENIADLDPRLQLDIIRALESDHLQMSVDVGHAFCMHTQHSAPPPDQFIAEASKHLAHVHLQDTDGYLDRHWLPSEGKINFKAIFDELAKLEHKPRLIIEVNDKAAVRKAAEWLKRFTP